MTTHKTNPFGPLTQWWSGIAKHFNRHHYASHSISALANSNTTDDWAEYAQQVQYSRDYTQNNAPGCVFFRTGFLSGPNATGLGSYLRTNKFGQLALTPEITWKNHSSHGTVDGLSLSSSTLSWSAVSTDELLRYTVYAIPEGIGYEDALASDGDGIKAEYLLGITYANSYWLPTDRRKGYGYAVCILDGYGKEYAPQTYGVTGMGALSSSAFALHVSGRMLHFTQTAAEVEVCDMGGAVLTSLQYVEQVRLDLPKGVYVVRATSENGARLTRKVILY